MDIYLIRHGQSTGNDQQRFCGWSDHPLTPRGEQQAAAAAARLDALRGTPIICSDLRRARMTAEIMARHLDAPISEDPRWRETHQGALEGCPWEEFSRDAALTQRFDEDPLGTPMPGGESINMMRARVLAAFTDLCARPAEQLIVVTHDGPLRAVLTHCLQIPPARYWTLATDHGGVSRVTLSEDWVSVRWVNEVGHLAGIG
jgi:broad specificity phosphatase PhoE